jgi:WD40 repeat protein/outer membrane protein assembly factor BamD (BamD/ComL family)
MRSFLFALISAFAFLSATNAVWAEGRFALLIGNKDYSSKIGRLKNPVNDVGLVKDALVKVGFDPNNIEIVTNANLGALNKARREFQQRLRAAGDGVLGFFYYSGHGAASRLDDKGSASNFIIPIDVDDTKSPLEMFESSLPLSEVVRNLRSSAPLADLIVVFDACRNELKLTATAIDYKTFVAEPLPPNGNTFLGFSTNFSSVAFDGGDDGGPFAKSLAQEIVRRDEYHEQVFYNVSLAVMAATKNKQQPTYFDGFKKRLFFVEKPEPVNLEEITLWNDVIAGNSIDGFREYIRRYPSSSRVREATRRLLERQEEVAWNLALGGGQRADFESFLESYPDGKFSQRARDQLTAIAKAEEDREWRAAKKSNSVEAILQFLGKYPNTNRYDEAKEAISQKRSATAEQKEQQQDEAKAWKDTQLLDSIPAYNKYLAMFGSSGNAQLAGERLAALLEIQEWDDKRTTKSAAGLRKFAAKYPTGPHAANAIDLANSLDQVSTESQSPMRLAMNKGISEDIFKQQKRLERQNLFFPQGTFSILASGKISERLDFRKAQPIRRLLLTNSLTKLYSGGDDGAVRMWDLNGSEKSESLSPSHSKKIYALARSDNTRYMATGSWDRQVFLWDSNSNNMVGKIGVRPQVLSMAFSPTGRWIAAAGTDGQVDFIRVKDQHIVNRRQVTPPHSIFAMAYLPNRSEDLIIGDTSGALRLWSVVKGQEIYFEHAHKEKILALTVSPDGQRIASAGTDRTIKIWTNRLKPVFEIDKAHLRYVTSLRFSPDGRFLASGGGDGLIRIWDTSSQKLARGPFVGHASDVEDIEFSPDGHYLFTSSEDSTARIWDVDAARLLYTLVPFPNGNYVIFDPEERYLASDEIRSVLNTH